MYRAFYEQLAEVKGKNEHLAANQIKILTHALQDDDANSFPVEPRVPSPFRNRLPRPTAGDTPYAIELKLIEEEGLAKQNRQAAVASIFREQQSNVPIVAINPKRLPEDQKRQYYRQLERPIKEGHLRNCVEVPRSAGEKAETAKSQAP